MDRFFGRVALVTGASAGIGAELVKVLVTNGMKVVGCARNIDRLQKLRDELSGEKGAMFPIRCDIEQPEDILSMFESIKSNPQLGGVDVCVNNAGLSHNEPLLSGDHKQWKQMLDVNVLGLCICSREAYKSMKERNVDDGYIIMLNSMSGHRVLPSGSFHVYSATKYAVTAITEGLRQELREENSGIRVSAISPGLVETEFAERFLKSKEAAQTLYSTNPCILAEDVVNTILHMLQSPPRVQIHDVLIRATHQKT